MKKILNALAINDYSKFLIGILTLIITVFIMDYLIGNFLRTFYFKQQSGLQYRTTYSIEKTGADLLIFGSSTANHNYETDIFGKRLNKKSYNVGRDGTSIFYDYAVLLGALKRYLPEIIILNFDQQEFVYDQASYDQLSSLLPYYENHPELRTIISLKGPNEKYKLLSHIYPFNSSIFTIVVGNLEFNKTRQDDFDGYVPLAKVWNRPIEHDSGFIDQKLDTNKIKLYTSFIKDCMDKKIKLYIVCSPIYLKSDHLNNSILIGKQIANAHKMSFFDFSNDSIFLENPKLFADINHLNEEGARLFSNKVVDTILGNER